MDTTEETPNRGLFGGEPGRRRAAAPNAGPKGPLVVDPYGSAHAAAAFRTWVDAPGPLEVEIGFGRGHFLAAHAAALRSGRLLGFEVSTRICYEAMANVHAAGAADRVRISQCDARAALREHIPAGRLAALHVNFPDPWWKKRHHKRRVIDEQTVALFHRALATGAALWFRTDVSEYAERVLELVRAHAGFAVDRFEPGALPPTARERRCEEYGLPVHRFRFTRT